MGKKKNRVSPDLPNCGPTPSLPALINPKGVESLTEYYSTAAFTRWYELRLTGETRPPLPLVQTASGAYIFPQKLEAEANRNFKARSVDDPDVCPVIPLFRGHLPS